MASDRRRMALIVRAAPAALAGARFAAAAFAGGFPPLMLLRLRLAVVGHLRLLK